MNYVVDHIPRTTPHDRRPGLPMEWRKVKGYEGHYEVSEYGDVKSVERTIVMKNGVERSIKEKIINWKPKSNGYFFVQLHKDGQFENKYVHRLVAENFISNHSNLTDVNHKDGRKENNHHSNLEWVTHSQNLLHAYKKGLKKTGEKHQQSKLTNADVLFIRENYKPFDEEFGAKPLAERFGVGRSTISTIARKIKRKHG